MPLLIILSAAEEGPRLTGEVQLRYFKTRGTIGAFDDLHLVSSKFFSFLFGFFWLGLRRSVYILEYRKGVKSMLPFHPSKLSNLILLNLAQMVSVFRIHFLLILDSGHNIWIWSNNPGAWNLFLWEASDWLKGGLAASQPPSIINVTVYVYQIYSEGQLTNLAYCTHPVRDSADKFIHTQARKAKVEHFSLSIATPGCRPLPPRQPTTDI